jgi:predicted dehydrogenase
MGVLMSVESSQFDPGQKPIGWGILGTGGIARLFTNDLRLNGMDVRAVGSRSRDSAERFASDFAIPSAYASYEELAADPAVDVIYVATPHPFHAENALLALRHGKHVLIEKPFTLNAAQAREVVGEAEKRGLLVLEAMWTRFLPHMIQVREIIAQGTIGNVRTVIADHGQLLPTDPLHRLNNPELGGGALLDLGIYPVSLAVDILGIPSDIHAIARPTATGVDAQTSILFNYASGAHALLQTALDALGPTRASIIGSDGRIEIQGVWYEPSTFDVFDRSGKVVQHWEQPTVGRGMQYEALEVEKCLRQGLTSSSLLPPAQSIAIMEILDAIRQQIGVHYAGYDPEDNSRA